MAEAKSRDIVELLKQDHREVEQLFEQFEQAKGDGRKQKLAQEICKELTIHAMLEEEIFYPACEGKIEDDMLKEAYVEHDAAKMLIAEIDAGDPSGEFYDSKVKVLKEEIEHHIKEEEKQTGSLFKRAREVGVDLDGLADKYAQRKAQLSQELVAGALPDPQTTTLEKAQF
jgi:hemerythrin superfamily protein